MTVHDLDGFFGSVRLRYFGPRPLTEDAGIESEATALLSAQVGYQTQKTWSITADIFNLLKKPNTTLTTTTNPACARAMSRWDRFTFIPSNRFRCALPSLRGFSSCKFSEGFILHYLQAMSTKRKTVKPSDPVKVDEYIQNLKHPLMKVVVALRKIILSTDKEIGEEIFWNAPAFFYTGEMKPFALKEYKRYIVGFNLYQKDCVRLIFLTGAKVKDSTGLLEGDYADGRRLAFFHDLKEVKAKEKALQKVIKQWLKMLDK